MAYLVSVNLEAVEKIGTLNFWSSRCCEVSLNVKSVHDVTECATLHVIIVHTVDMMCNYEHVFVVQTCALKTQSSFF